MDTQYLTSYPFLRRANWQIKVSLFKNKSVLVIGNHVLNVDKFFVKHFNNLEHAANFIEFIIEKDFYE